MPLSIAKCMLLSSWACTKADVGSSQREASDQPQGGGDVWRWAALALTSLPGRKESLPAPCSKHQDRQRSHAISSWQEEEACPGPLCRTHLLAVASGVVGVDLLCWCLFSSGFQRQ